MPAEREFQNSEVEGPGAGFLADAPDSVREQVSASQRLRDFLPGAGALTLDDRRRLVEQAIVLLDQIYVHLTLESAMQAVNPVQRLRLLRRRLEHQADVNDVPEWRFHQEMSSIFHSVRDLHTNYLLPTTTPDVADGPVDISVVASG